MSSVMDKLCLMHIIIFIFIPHISHNFTHKHIIQFTVIIHISHSLPYLASKKSILSLEIQEFVNITQKFNTKFPSQDIRSPEHFRYNQVPKTEVPETRTDCSSIVHDPAHCSENILAKNFILLNFRLNEIFVESKNPQIGVRV